MSASFFKDSPIILHAESMKVRSGFLSFVSGVGTAITTMSELLIWS